jgi:hypothetical protein
MEELLPLVKQLTDPEQVSNPFVTGKDPKFEMEF